jgi:2-amino-4-hydroxy-6-hydroxymethyldihydropteridine diphosphokinase
MPRCLISLGANLGDPLSSMKQALYWLTKSFGDAAVRASRFYRTPAIGGPENQQEFLNAVVAVETLQSPWDVWHVIRDIEQRMGRTRQLRWEARAIDIDVLLYEDQRIWTPHFKVPHPRMAMRRFVLQPAMEIAADWLEPVSGWTIQQLFEHISDGAPSILVCGDATQDLPELTTQALKQLLLPATQTTCYPLLENSDFTKDQPWFQTLPWEQLAPSLCLPTLANLRLHGDIPKVLVVAAAPPPEIDIAWEDWLRCWADALGMRYCKGPKWNWPGPRYLLPMQDRQWAIHELIAAIQAMQCPLEPMD